MNYSLIIPIYNEGRLLNTLLESLSKFKNNIEIIIVDDGSNDQTKEILEKIENYTIIKRSVNKGKGSAILKGVKAAKNTNLIFMDGDLEIDISIISKLIKNYEKENITRPITGIRWYNNENLKFEINRMGNYFINNIFNLIYGSNYNDVLCCVKIIDKDLFNTLKITSPGFSIEVEIMAKLWKKNIKIIEHKVHYKRRSPSEGKKLKITDSWEIIKIIFKENFLKK